MVRKRISIHGEWTTRWAFVLAATGSAVGLGNIWKFPYIAGENGGGAFVLVYLLCITVIGIPIMIAEVMIGRRGRQSPVNTMYNLGIESGSSPHWKWLGWLGVVSGFIILSYYTVIAGWALDYVFKAATGSFTNASAESVSTAFGTLVSNPMALIAWQTVFMIMTMVVVARGVNGGLEKAVRLLMPSLFVLLIILVGYAISTGEFMRGLTFLFEPNFDTLLYKHEAGGEFILNTYGDKIFTLEYVLIALGHAFFTLSLGMGAIMVYGSYLPRKTSIAKTTFIIAGADTLVALLAGMAIFPIVFANNLDPGKGPGLIFETLPLAFGHMPGGMFFGTLFFVLLVFAAWTSSISLIEPAAAWLVENKGMKRNKASIIIGVSCWALGLFTVFSFNIWKNVHPLDFWVFKNKTFFDVFDYLTANLMLPLGGLAIAIFSVWIMSCDASSDELEMKQTSLAYNLWYFMTRYVTPLAMLVVFANLMGLI